MVRNWTVPADLMERLLKGPSSDAEESRAENDPLAGGDKFFLQMPDLLETHYAIPFPSGTSASFSPNRGELVVRQTADRLAEIEALLNSLGPMEPLVLDDKLFSPMGELVLNGGDYPSGLATRKWHVAPEVIDEFLDSIELQATQRGKHRRTLSEALRDCGISVGDGTSVTYDRESTTVTSVNTESNAFYTEMLLLDSAIAVSRKSAKENPNNRLGR